MQQDCVGENDFAGAADNTEGRSRRRSEVWKDFTEDKRPDGSAGARCKHCGLLLSASSNSGTSHLNRHLKLHCPRKKYKDVKEMFASASVKQCNGGSKGFKLDQDVSRRNLAKLVISAELPFDIVEQPTFVNFVMSLQPMFQFVGRETVKSDCVVLYEEEKCKTRNMLKSLKSRVSFSFDLWTSDQSIGYMALSAHFIDDDFVLKKKILNFKRIAYPYTSFMISDEIAKCIVEWELVEKVFALTLDNSPINDDMAMRLKENWYEKLLANGNYLHIRCCVDILNSMAEDGIAVLHLVTERIRNIIKYVSATPSRMQAFNESAQQCELATSNGLMLDFSTKWNVTYDMLQSALSYKEALIRYARAHCQDMDAPTGDDWKKTEVIMKLLKAFVNAIDVFSRTKYPIVNLYYREVWTIRHLLQDEIASCDEMVRALTFEMQKKFKKYWNECNIILAIASILDPRYKFIFIQYCYEDTFGEETTKLKIDEIRDCLYKLYNDYEKGQKKNATCEESNRQGLSEFSGGLSTLEHVGKRKLEMEFAIYRSKNILKKPKRNELDAYLETDVLPAMEDEDFSVLSWWKKSAGIYPVLSMMAQDVLAIPVSIVASKSAFSSYSRLINQYGISLDSSIAETLICSRDWFHNDYCAGKVVY